MSSKNSETNGYAIGIAFVAAAAMFLAIIVYVIAGILTAVLSVMAVMALWKPLKVGKHIITPHEARWFLIRGIIGTYAFPVVAVIVASMLKTRINSDWDIHLMVIGYILGSVGGEFVIAEVFGKADEEAGKPEILLPAPASRAEKSPGNCNGTCSILPNTVDFIEDAERKARAPTFEYATWDDEDEDPYR